jgi:hypothetical protein
VRRQLQEWIGNSADVWTEQIGLTRREQEIARRDLAHVGVWEEARVGIPPRRLARIRLDCLLARLAGDESGDANRIVCRIRQSVVLPQSIVDKKAKQVCGIPTFMFCRKRQN